MSNLQEIKDLVSISAVADYLGLVEEYGKRKFPGERTASIQLYKDNRFHDFGRNVDGDIFDLMIHVRGYTLKEAIAELKSAFNIKDSPIGKNTVKEAWIAYLERKFNAKYIEHYDYFLTDRSGKAVYAYTKVRLQDKAGKKKLIYGMFNGDRFILGLQGKKAKDILAIYGSSVLAIQKAIDHQKTIFYVEGEKDVNTLMKRGSEALLRKIVREESGNNSSGNYRFTAQINRRTIFDEIIDEAKLRRSTSGRNPFELA